MLPDKSPHPVHQNNDPLIENLEASQKKLISDIELLRAKYKRLTSKPVSHPSSIDATRNNPPTISAAALMKNRFTGNVSQASIERSNREFHKTLVIIFAALLIVSLGWLFISRTNFLSGGDFVYNTGLLGGILMLCATLYAVTKRFHFLNRLTGKDQWYYLHLLCGTAGPLLIVFHTTFNIKSINSAVAVACMLTIVFSGIFGRFFYTRLGYYMHENYQKLAYSERSLYRFLNQINCNLANRVSFQLTTLVSRGIKLPEHWYNYPSYLGSLVYLTTVTYISTRNNIRHIVQGVSVLANWDASAIANNQHQLSTVLKTYLGSFLGLTIATALQAIMSHWRLLHVPILYLLIFTSTAHIIAVHMY